MAGILYTLKYILLLRPIYMNLFRVIFVICDVMFIAAWTRNPWDKSTLFQNKKMKDIIILCLFSFRKVRYFIYNYSHFIMPGAGLGSHLHCFSCLHLVIKMSSLYNPFCAWRLIHIWDTVLWWLFCLVLLYWWFSFWHQYPLKSSLYCCRFLFLCSLAGFRGNLWT